MVYSLYLVVFGEAYDEMNYVVKAKSENDAIEYCQKAGERGRWLSTTKLNYKGPIIVSIRTGD